MGKYDVDFNDYEEKQGSGYDGPPPTKGNYDAELVSLKEHTSAAGGEGLEWIFRIPEGDFAGWQGYVYSNMDSSKWKTQQIVKAINGGEEAKTSLDPSSEDSNWEDRAKSKTVKKAKRVRIRVINETYEDERRAKIRTVMPSDNPDAGGKKKKKKDDDPV